MWFFNFDRLFCALLHFMRLDESVIRQVLQNLSLWKEIKVNYEGILSDYCTILQGVAQGSILGPFLYSIYTSYLPEVVRYSAVHMYADYSVVTYLCDIWFDVLIKESSEVNIYVVQARYICRYFQYYVLVWSWKLKFICEISHCIV